MFYLSEKPFSSISLHFVVVALMIISGSKSLHAVIIEAHSSFRLPLVLPEVLAKPQRKKPHIAISGECGNHGQ